MATDVADREAAAKLIADWECYHGSLHDCIANAIVAARAEGRRQGLQEAIEETKRVMASRASFKKGTNGNHIVDALSSLAAPTTPCPKCGNIGDHATFCEAAPTKETHE